MSTEKTGKTRSNNTAAIVLGVIAALLLVAVIYLFVQNNKLSEQVASQTTELDEAAQLQAELQSEYDQAIAELDDLMGSNAELNSMIEEQKAELEKQRSRIARLIRSQNDYEAARAEIANLKEQINEYVGEIEQLNAENESLKQDTSNLRANLKQAAEQQEAITVAYEELEVEREQLEGKVNVASVVQVKNIDVTGYKIKNNGKLKEKDNAKRVDQLKVCFETVPNKVVEPGMEQFYVRIINPVGETLAVESMGSGTLRDAESGQDVRYTKYVETEYEKGQEQMCTQWKSQNDFPEGQYTVEIYNKGYLSGQGTFTLD